MDGACAFALRALEFAAFIAVIDFGGLGARNISLDTRSPSHLPYFRGVSGYGVRVRGTDYGIGVAVILLLLFWRLWRRKQGRKWDGTRLQNCTFWGIL